ncbi:membrane protein [Candidatus Magnetomorum sp. HK-1]|nr:membrane protein [Candidatus Magnetomorum sp. HK-1]
MNLLEEDVNKFVNIKNIQSIFVSEYFHMILLMSLSIWASYNIISYDIFIDHTVLNPMSAIGIASIGVLFIFSTLTNFLYVIVHLFKNRKFLKFAAMPFFVNLLSIFIVYIW